MTRAAAPGKIILLGEHAVVYGRPAIAVPVRQVQAVVDVEELPDGRRDDVLIDSPTMGLRAWLSEMGADDPLSQITRRTLEAVEGLAGRSISVRIDSTIPIASGLGSGAAVSVAVARGLSRHLGRPLDAQAVSELAFEVEKLHHGTPSGIDNTVIAFDRPVYFVRGSKPETLSVGAAVHLVIADTGRAASTAVAVAHVRRRWEADRTGVERVFDDIAHLVRRARSRLEAGEPEGLGLLMNENQTHLEWLGVSSPELDRLVLASRDSGAYGAKLSGGGMGGHMIAIVPEAAAPAVAQALQAAGATHVITTRVDP
ncbi:MAG TPA: mevalonate kinase [Anaerolineales bacterium]|nr:mevalonate kinase [Anaerolineales bacterium]